MASKSNLPKTDGSFRCKGIVGGVGANGFFTEETVNVKRNGVDVPVLRRSLRFYVQTSSKNRINVTLTEYKPDNVYFFKKGENGAKGVTKSVSYSDARRFNEEGFNIIGCKCGLEKVIDQASGKPKNKVVTFCNYDAIDYIKEHLTDGVTVFVRGTMTNSRGKNGTLYTNLVPNQISLMQDMEIEKVGSDNDHKEIADFSQKIIFQGVDKNEGEENSFTVNAMLLDYSGKSTSISYYCYNMSLAKNLRKLSAYTAIDVEGHFENRVIEQEVDDSWGTPREATKGYDRRMVIDYANPDSIDTDTYTEEAIAALNRASEEYGTPYASDEDEVWD